MLQSASALQAIYAELWVVETWEPLTQAAYLHDANAQIPNPHKNFVG